MPHVQCFTNSCILILWKTCFHVITAWKRQHWNVVSEKELVVPFCPSVSLSVEIWLSALWSHSLYICLTFSFVLLVTFTFCGLTSIQCPGVVSVGQWWSMCDWKMSFCVCVVIIWRVLTGIALLLISALKKKKKQEVGRVGVKAWWADPNRYVCLLLEGHRRTWENQQISGHKVRAHFHFSNTDNKIID